MHLDVRRLSSIAALLAALAACSEAPFLSQEAPPSEIISGQPAEAVAFLAMADRHAAAILAATPELASGLGVDERVAGPGYLARLSRHDTAAEERLRALNESMREDLAGVDRGELPRAEAVTHDALRHAYDLAARRNAFPFGEAASFGVTGPYRVTQLTGLHLSFPRLLERHHPIASRWDAEAYLARLADSARAFDEAVVAIRRDASAGFAPPRFALLGAAGGARAFTAPAPSEHPLIELFLRRLDMVEALPREARARFASRAVDAMETFVYPAYLRYAAALEALAEHASDEPGLGRFGDAGAEFYALALESYGSAGLSGEEIHAIGLSEVARVTEEMRILLEREGIAGGELSFGVGRLSARSNGRYQDSDEGRSALLADANRFVADAMRRAPAYFSALPAESVEVRRMPEEDEARAPGGFYSGPPRSENGSGVFWINLRRLADWPKQTLKSIVFHETVPGHHVQVGLHREAGELPLIRSIIPFPEFVEGWALYAEALAAEMGLYEGDPLGDLGRLDAERFRAARLVVDTGIHVKGWSRAEAAAYLQSAAGLSEAEAAREADRYAVLPGQACSYKLGMLKIVELRRRAEEALGSRFDIRAFHDEVLRDGAIPLPALERKIERWIAARLG